MQDKNNLERILCAETQDIQTPCKQSECISTSDAHSSLMDTLPRLTTSDTKKNKEDTM